MKSFLQRQTVFLGCDITLCGEVSPTDGKVLPQAFRCPPPQTLHKVSFRTVERNRGIGLGILRNEWRVLAAPQGARHEAISFQTNTHPKKRISHRAPSDADFKICFHVGRSAVGKFLRGLGLGRGELLSRSLPLPKVLLSPPPRSFSEKDLIFEVKGCIM